MPEFITIDHCGDRSSLRYLARGDPCSLVMLHESAGVVEQYLHAAGRIDDVVFVLTWSWHCDRKKAKTFSAYIDRLCDAFPRQAATIRNNVIFAMNSPEETRWFSEALPGVRVVTVNNACFLSKDVFRPSRGNLGEISVMNAKPLAFKRHFLSCLVNPKVFIAYNEEIAKGDTDYRDITKYGAAEIYWDISESDVNEINGDGLCGLALSAIEGACYASTEYLLCGLPVVSTESVGGRDAYYDSENAVMVAASPQDVMRGVSTVLARRDEFDRWAIHRRAVARSREFQHSLAEALAAATSGSAGQFVSLIEDAVCNDNKLWAHRNFWVRELLRPDATERFASRARSR